MNFVFYNILRHYTKYLFPSLKHYKINVTYPCLHSFIACVMLRSKNIKIKNSRNIKQETQYNRIANTLMVARCWHLSPAHMPRDRSLGLQVTVSLLDDP